MDLTKNIISLLNSVLLGKTLSLMSILSFITTSLSIDILSFFHLALVLHSSVQNSINRQGENVSEALFWLHEIQLLSTEHVLLGNIRVEIMNN